jgi:hypothetical protein
MSLLISPKLIPFIEYDYELVRDERTSEWVAVCPPSNPMRIKNDWGDVLDVQGDGLKQQLHKIATIYRNADGETGAVPRKLLSVPAIAEVGSLRGTNHAKSRAGLLFQMSIQYCIEWDLGHGEWGLNTNEVQKGYIDDWGLVGLTPDAIIAQDGFFFTAPDIPIAREWVGGSRCSYDELVEREFAANE